MTADQIKPYGECNDCGVILQSKEASLHHQMDTIPERSDATGRRVSHSTHVLHPPREDKLAGNIVRIVEEALGEAIDELEELLGLDGGYTAKEITEALRHHEEFRDAWKAYLDV